MKTLGRVLVGILVIVVVALLSQYRADISLEELKEKYADEQSQFMQLDGMSIHYKVEGKGFPVLLVHGTGSSLHTWDGWVPYLSEQFKVIRLDLPAFGLTGPNEDNNYSAEYYVDLLHRFLNELGVDSLHIAGNSLGGMIAYNYVLQYPNDVGKLILIDAAGYPRETPIPFAFKIGRTPLIKNLMKYVSPRSLFDKSIKEVYLNDSLITDELVDRYYELSLREGNRAALVARMNQDFDNRYQEINSIIQPTLIMWGIDDLWIPASDAKKFKEDIRNSTVMMYKAGHVPMEELPDFTVRDARNFLAN